MSHWERRLADEDTNRVVRPFEWGLEWLGIASQNGNAGAELAAFAAAAVSDSEAFYSYEKPTDYRLVGSTLEFSSPIQTPYPENNSVYAEYFPCSRSAGRAVVVLPQWNADTQGHLGLCKLLNQAGMAALRLSLAYHHRRMPPGLDRADFHVSSNLGRTIQATRQSVVDARACLDWLEGRGYRRLGILGTSLGSCVALLVTAHDRRPRAAVFNHVSMNFSDVVWTGMSCRHIRATLNQHLSKEELHQCWSVISPSAYLDRLEERDLTSLLVWARYDSTFLPEYSKQVLEAFRQRQLLHEAVCLPCGHYTSGRFPFHIWNGLIMSDFLRRML